MQIGLSITRNLKNLGSRKLEKNRNPMKKTITTFIILLITCVANCVAQVSFGTPQLFNDGWEFSLDNADWKHVALPHDWSIEGTPSPDLASCTGYLPGGVGQYRKTFTISDSKSKHYIYFEGVYNRSEVYLNGHLLGKRPNGYISFMYDMTPYLTTGKNELLVRVDHSKYADSRWYSGSGIYRNVWLIASGDTHFSQWGVTYSAKQCDDDMWNINVSADIDGYKKGLSLKIMLFDADGRMVTQSLSTCKSASNKAMLSVSAPHLWSIDTPYLYNMKVELLQGETIVDATNIAVGIRSLQFDANKGFALNGKWMKIKGVCLHHDAGVLGAAVPKDVWRRRLISLKEIGANAIRMSHNPQSPDLYDLCDELGFLVMDEGSDEWEFPKRKWLKGWNKGEPGYDGTFDFFEEWIERDVTDMVMRDRNHPSVFLWSVGNEVDYPNDPYSHPILDGKNSKINQPMFGGYKPDAPNAERIGRIAKRLAACIRRADTSRPVTGALAGVVMSNETAYPDAVDVVGYNYTEDRYATDHAAYPNRIIYGSETHGDLKAWKAVRDNDHIFGQFVWTGMDYLGESGAWPSRGLGTGLLDFAAFPKQQGYFIQSLWSEKPMIHIAVQRPRRWQREQSKGVTVVCFTNAHHAQLLMNGNVVGEMMQRNDTTGMILWNIPQVEGTLMAQAYDADGHIVATHTIAPTGDVSQLRVTDVTVDKSSEVKQLLVEAVDADGNLVRTARNNVTCSVNGTTILLGLENANNVDMSAPKSTTRSLHNGRLIAYVKGNVSDVKFDFQPMSVQTQ